MTMREREGMVAAGSWWLVGWMDGGPQQKVDWVSLFLFRQPARHTWNGRREETTYESSLPTVVNSKKFVRNCANNI